MGKKSNPKAISLFAGIGGFDIGFEKAGFNIEWANDFDKYCVMTYKKNVSDKIVLGDIRKVKDQIPEHDVLLGGFPCQPFSSLGSQKGFNDEKRGTLFFEITDILKKHKTKVLVLENVKNIMSHDHGKTFKRIISELESLGYKCFYSVLNSQNFGVPQRRNRCYIVGFLKEDFDLSEDFVFPKGKATTIKTKDILDQDVPEKYFLTKKISNTILGTGTKSYHANPTIDTDVSKTLVATMAKMHRACQDNYFTDNQNFEKYCDKSTKTNIRRLTPNECRKLQGFPDKWTQIVSDCQAYKQFGNAVTVNVSNAVAKAVLKYMKKHLKNNQ
jgi:DNA (cytosine-5)-methyltransferase 1